MSQIQPAGGRLLQSLQSRISPSTQQLFAGTPIAAVPHTQTQNLPTTTDSVSDTPIQEDVVVPANPTNFVHDLNPSDDNLAEAEKLAIFDDVLEQVESGAYAPQQAIATALDPTAIYTPSEDTGLFAQAIPAAVTQAEEQIQQQMPAAPSGRPKEHLEGAVSGVAASELPADIQYVEEEKSPELPPEVESYIQHVEEAAQVAPQKIVVAQEPSTLPNAPVAPPRIVKVLPLTKAQEEMGLRKNTSFSIRWLVEFGHKIAKALVGQVVYKEN